MGRARTAGPALTVPASGARVYTAGQIAVATLIGTPLAGSVLLASNWTALGDQRRSDRTLQVGALATAVAMLVAFGLPDSLPNTLVPATYTLIVTEIARRMQGSRLSAHRAAGGRPQSHLRMLAIAAVSLLFVAITCISIQAIATRGTMWGPAGR